MPKATIGTASERHDLKTCPGGFVELRRMTYDKWLQRQEMALRMQFQGDNKNNMTGEIGMANKAVTMFEFQQCIVDHNLEDDAGGRLNLNNMNGLALLDPRIGNEIGDLIDAMHNWKDDLGNSGTGSEQSS